MQTDSPTISLMDFLLDASRIKQFGRPILLLLNIGIMNFKAHFHSQQFVIYLELYLITEILLIKLVQLEFSYFRQKNYLI